MSSSERTVWKKLRFVRRRAHIRKRTRGLRANQPGRTSRAPGHVPGIRLFLQQNGDLYSKLALDEMKEPVTEQEIEDIVFQGGLVILIPLTNQMYSLDISNAPKRTPEEPNVEISIKGPKDGFTEDFVTNIALIRSASAASPFAAKI